ncbi:hypothetical protein [Pseudolactococcus reticulitermitis]|uniref:Uncharacterized protein n=1 Tax=Pseudolactococcus reticulitermitis TaxID=2025039 RepID=A0A224WWP7_9LACT|nr:hypothetical protein [Lactococcus reticulitermitis]GAX46759.1 hypothetical protein RsY01_338 [Lactococcus reticulitermitis]
MALNKITSQGTLNSSSTINGATAAYFSASIETNGKFNFSISGNTSAAIFGTDNKVSAEVKSDINAFISAVYKQAQVTRSSYTSETVPTEVEEVIND